MRILPVAERELRVASRRRGTYWVRFASAAVAIVASAFVFMAMMRERTSAQGQALFVTLTTMAFGYCVLCGVFTSSDCVSEEKRDGTLGLLFLTDLRGYDVVLGKLAATSMRAVCALAAMIPILALPMLMGGVSGKSVFAVACVLANTMFLSLATGVAVSVLARDSRHAIGATFLALATLLAILPLIRWLIVDYALRPAPATGPGLVEPRLAWMLTVNPAVLFAVAIESVVGMGTARRELWTSLAVQHALAWATLLAACIALPRVWQDRVESRRTPKERRGKTEARSASRTELLDLHPFAWIVARDTRAAVTTWIGLGVVAAGWIWGFAEVRSEWLLGIVAVWTMFWAALWLKVRLAAMACRHLLEHRRTGALELLLCTPVTSQSVVRGCLLGMRQALLPQLAAVLAAGALLFVAALTEERGGAEANGWRTILLVGTGAALLDLWTIAWTGMWRGLRSGRYVRAYGATVGLVLVLPWALFIVSLISFAILQEVMPDVFRGQDPGFWPVLGWWCLISIGVNVVLLVNSREGLRRCFLDIAAAPRGLVPATSDVAVGLAAEALRRGDSGSSAVRRPHPTGE